jgi:hypothetical protein
MSLSTFAATPSVGPRSNTQASKIPTSKRIEEDKNQSNYTPGPSSYNINMDSLPGST